MSILKWVGGKGQLLERIENFLPKKISTYYEPFVGGGSVFIHILKLCEEGQALINPDPGKEKSKTKIHVNKFIINDINTELINLYQMIQKNHVQLIKKLEKIEKIFIDLPEAKKSSKKREKIKIPKEKKDAKTRKVFYYFIRQEYNKLKKNPDIKKIKRAVLFLFLNRTSWRGVYRENKKKQYNVSYGNYKNPKICDTKKIERLHSLFTEYDINFTNKPFEVQLPKIPNSSESFVYLDPPYYPKNEKSFVSYSAGGFDKDENIKLFALMKTLHQKGVKFLMSNSCTKWVLEQSKHYHITKIKCKRLINSKNPKDTAMEVLVNNWKHGEQENAPDPESKKHK